MPWGKRNYNQKIETQISRIRIVDHIAANVDTESEMLLYLNYRYFSGVYSHLYLRRFTYNPGSYTTGSVHQSIQKERKPIH